MGRLVQVIEGEVLDSTLDGSVKSQQVLATGTHFAQQLPQDDEKGHQVSCVTGIQSLGISSAHVLGSGTHSGRNDFACCVHKQLGQPFEDLLDDLGVRFL